MAKQTRISNAAAIAACDAIAALLNGGSANPAGLIRIYTGAQPAGVDAGVGGATLLVELDISNPAFGSAVDADPGGRATANAVTDGVAGDSGTATWFRALDRDRTAVLDGSVGTSNADLIINNTSINASQIVKVNAWTLTMPEG